jgi:hypothetical protein
MIDRSDGLLDVDQLPTPAVVLDAVLPKVDEPSMSVPAERLATAEVVPP